MKDFPLDVWIIILTQATYAFDVLLQRGICKASLEAFPHVPCRIPWSIAPVYLQAFFILSPRMDHRICGRKSGVEVSLRDCLSTVIVSNGKLCVLSSVYSGGVEIRSIVACAIFF